MNIITTIKNYFRKKLRKRGFFYYKSQKLDGPFEGYIIFRKEWNESWTVALKASIKSLQESDDRLHGPVMVKFFTKL